MEKFNALKTLVLEAERDAEKFYERGNNSAGTRVRKHMQDIVALARDIRKEVSEIRNNPKAEEVPAAEASAAPAAPAA